MKFPRVQSAVAVVLLAVAPVVLVQPIASAATPAGSYQPLATVRILDTRVGTGAPKAPVAANGTVKLKVLGVGGIPASGVSTVMLNLRVTQPTAGGALTAWPDGSARPGTVSIFFSAGQTLSQFVPVKVGTGGLVDLYNNSTGKTHFIADVAGYYTAGTAGTPGSYTPLTPTPLVNTASGLGVPKAPIGANATVTVQASGKAGLPATNVGTVTLSVSVTKGTAAGSLVFTSTGAGTPSGTSLEYGKSQTLAELVTVPLNPTGKFDLRNASAGTVTVYVDVLGYTVAGVPARVGAFKALPPTRLFSSSVAAGSNTTAPLPSNVPLPTNSRFGVGDYPFTAIAVKVSMASASSGTVTVYPNTQFQPANSHLAYAGGLTAGTVVFVPIARTSGFEENFPQLTFSASTAGTLTADVVGYVLNGSDSKGAVTGKVVDSAGRPIAGSMVEIDTDPFGEQGQSVVTSDDGTYLIPFVNGTEGGGGHAICFGNVGPTANSPTGYLGECYNNTDIFNATPFTVSAGSAATINTTLATAGGVRGKVTDSTGKALKGVQVNISSQANTVTDAAGNWSVIGLAQAPVTACFHAPDTVSGGSTDATGYLDVCYNSKPPSSPTSIAVGAGFTSNINQAMQSGGAISGTVKLTNGGSCMCSAEIYAGSSTTDPPIASQQANFDTGKYIVRNLPAGTYHVVFDSNIQPYTYPTPVTVTAGKVTANINASVTK